MKINRLGMIGFKKCLYNFRSCCIIYCQMTPPTHFNTQDKLRFKLPLFFPDATAASIKSLDMSDVANTKTKGVLVNTLHLKVNPGIQTINKAGGIKKFMNWQEAVISDSGGFQIMSLIKSRGSLSKVTDDGVVFQLSKKQEVRLTPEESIRIQMDLGTDLVVVLDDFTPPNAKKSEAEDSVIRTILWAKKSKIEFERICSRKKLIKKPYLIAVVQGGKFKDLREYCAKKLSEIGFDGFGYGGWPLDKNGSFDKEIALTIKKLAPENYLLYGLGIGRPEDIVFCTSIGYHIFDCVLPTRDARHKRLYVFNARNINDINIKEKNFYSYYNPDKKIYSDDFSPVSTACDCPLCKNYLKAYFRHLWKTNELSAMRLSTIHNLRFYSLLMENLQKNGKM